MCNDVINVGSVWVEPTFVTSSRILTDQALSLLEMRLDRLKLVNVMNHFPAAI